MRGVRAFEAIFALLLRGRLGSSSYTGLLTLSFFSIYLMKMVQCSSQRKNLGSQ